MLLQVVNTLSMEGEVFSFKIGLGEVIRGWDEGIMKLSKGQRARLLISSDYGYGAEGKLEIIETIMTLTHMSIQGSSSGKIPPHADLIFDVELVAIGKPRRQLLGWDDAE